MNPGASPVGIDGYSPGDLGRVVELHGTYYQRHWNLGRQFEALVARGLADFLLAFDARHDGFWVARSGDSIAGSVSLVGPREGEPARLRWFVVDESRQGQGIGQRLLDRAMQFCADTGCRHVYLTTFAGLDAARRLYERGGFRLTRETEDTTWGRPMIEQRFDWKAG